MCQELANEWQKLRDMDLKVTITLLDFLVIKHIFFVHISMIRNIQNNRLQKLNVKF